MKIIPFNGKPYKKGWARVNNQVIDDPNLEGGDRLCFLALRRFVNKEGTCWPTHKQLGVICGCKERSINERINRLKKYGHLDWSNFRDKQGRKRNLYIFPEGKALYQQHHSAVVQQHPSAVKQDTDNLYCDTYDPPSPKLEESGPEYGQG